MCTLLFALDAHPELRLVIAANRDERYTRSTAPAMFWHDAPDVLAGRDLEAGGTWLGITRTGRWAGVTNIRDLSAADKKPRSRGWLTGNFLAGDDSPRDYLEAVAQDAHLFGGFNLVVGDLEGVWYLSNGEGQGRVERVEAGIHGVSNAFLDTPWPKVEHGREVLGQALASARDDQPLDIHALLDALGNDQRFPDESLPDTGMGLQAERVLSSLFISTPLYGTCSSTVITVRRSGEVRLVERTTNPRAEEQPVMSHQLMLR